MRRSAVPGARACVAPPIVHDVLRQPGRALEPSVSHEAQQALACDFSAVRVHADARAAASAEAVGAEAYTVGRHIVFANGRYAPATPAGRTLLTHELVHVIQQDAAEVPDDSLAVDPDPSLEAQARGVAGGEAPGDLGARVGPTLQGSFKSSPGSPCGGTRTCAPSAACTTPDTPGGAAASTTWQLTVKIDIEAPTPEAVTEATPGHAFVEFAESNGQVNTFGFYPDPARPPNFLRTTTTGCMVHPDTIHASCVDYNERFALTQPEYDKALDFARTLCKAPPSYDLFNFNCTTFASFVTGAAGKSLPPTKGKVGSWGVVLDNPNTLIEGLRDRDVPSRHAGTDTEIRDWLSANPTKIAGLPVVEKLRLVNRLLDGYVHDDDVAAVEAICAAVPTASEMTTIRAAITPRLSELNAAQGGRVRAAIGRTP